MDNKQEQQKGLTRRGLLPLLLGGIFMPYLGTGNAKADKKILPAEDDEIHETFLKADGSVVRVKRKAVRGARVIRKNVSNKTLLNWLNKK